MSSTPMDQTIYQICWMALVTWSKSKFGRGKESPVYYKRQDTEDVPMPGGGGAVFLMSVTQTCDSRRACELQGCPAQARAHVLVVL